MNDEKTQETLLDTLKLIQFVAQDLYDFAVFCDNISPGYIMSEMEKIIAATEALKVDAVGNVSYWLRFAPKLEGDQDESTLKPREWSISQAEVDEMAGRE